MPLCIYIYNIVLYHILYTLLYAVDHASFKYIEVEEFAAHISLLQKNKERCFAKEFNEAVKMDQMLSQHNVKLTISQNKNC